MRIVPLREAITEPGVGGKAAHLARLLVAGAPVPGGFVLAGTALQHFVAEQEALPRAVDHAVMEAWRTLLPGPVIVRSSAIGEDSAEASFAGQLDSVAGVTTEEGLRDAVLRVWTSQWSERVLAYQSARGTRLTGMAVVIQRQVDAVVSGVLFTRSPISPSSMLLEYCPGLGEALVSGAINPGRIAIDRHTLASAELASLEVPDERSACLTAEALRELASLALRIEEAFGAAQDIEWTIDSDGRCWIVQSRPITTSRRAHEPARQRTGGVRWSNANVNENFPQPISPLLYSVARQGYYHYFRNLGTAFGVSERRLCRMEPALRQIVGVHGARLYYNLTSIHHVLESAPFGDMLAAWFDDFVGAEAADASTPVKPSRAYEIAELAVIAAKTGRQFTFLTRRVSEFERLADRFAADTHPSRLGAKSTHELLADLRAFMDIRCRRWKNASLADAASMVSYGLLKRVLARAFPGEDRQALHNTLLKALPDLVSSMPPLKLWQLSRMVRANEPLHDLVRTAPAAEVLTRIRADGRFADFGRALDVFLEDWGFRCSGELMLTMPSFQEDPAPVIDLLRAYAATDGESPASQLARQSAERLRETQRVLRALRGRPLARQVPFLPLSLAVGVLLRWTQRSIQLRERARLKQALLYSRLRRVALALGGRLAEERLLAGAADIFFLTVDEIDLLVSGSEMFPSSVAGLVGLRQQAHGQLAASTPPDSICLAPGEYLAAGVGGQPSTECESATKLRGVGACGGSRTATAAILLDVTESHRLGAGDILVTKQTDPGWGPIFPLISGLVIERGGMLSHGAIIAREFGIPSVVGVKDATRLIQHGGSITVDGDRGLVHLGAGATA